MSQLALCLFLRINKNIMMLYPLAAVLYMLTSLSSLAQTAGISLGQTRVVFSAEDKAQTINIKNTDNRAYLIQARVQAPLNNEEASPFIVTPPLFTLQENSHQLTRIMQQDHELPNDRESLFYLTISAIPSQASPVTTKDRLSVGFQFHLKLFYRPSGLPLSPEDAYCRLTFSSEQSGIRVTNLTPFYQTLGSLLINESTEVVNSQESMVAPYGSLKLTFLGEIDRVSWQTVTDYGGLSKVCHQVLSDFQRDMP